MDREASPWGLALLVILTLTVRIGVVAYDFNGFGSDTDDYGLLAQHLVRTGTYGYPEDDGKTKRATAYRPPLYPALLCAAALNKGQIDKRVVAGIHVVLGLLTVLAVYYIAWRSSFRYPSIPALAVALDPILLNQSRELMTEGLVTLLSVWAWALYLILIRPTLAELGQTIAGMRFWLRTSLLLGLALGLACLTRPTMLPWACLVIGSLGLRSSEAGNRVSIISAALLVMLSLNVAWMMRNKSELGVPVFTTTHGGYTLLLANNPVVYNDFKKNGPTRDWEENLFHVLWDKRRDVVDDRPLDPIEMKFWEPTQEDLDKAKAVEGVFKAKTPIRELEDDKLATAVAVATIKDSPDTFVLSCLYRAGWFWSVYPNIREPKKESDAAQKVTASPMGDSASSKSAQNSLAKRIASFFAKVQQKWKPFVDRYKTPVAQWLIGAWYSLWFFMALSGLWYLSDILSSRQWLVPILLLVTLTAIHCVYFSNMRFRAPAMPVVYMLACWPLMRVRTLSKFAS